MPIIREFVHTLQQRLHEKSLRLQVVLGPRQVGKTTGIQQLLGKIRGPKHYASADDALSASGSWIHEHWQAALEKGQGTLLVIDEVQKISHWADTIKRLWDAEGSKPRLRCILLGSSSLQLQKGLIESLTGRFELVTVPHWGFLESKRAFRYTLETYLRFGGYPGGHAYIHDYPRWFSYMKNAVVDTVIGQDILSQHTVAKPALFRQVFEILCGYPAQEVSYTKLLGQLQDRGNTDLVKHYIELYEAAYLFKALFKFSPRHLTVKSSSPKIISLCPAFHTVAMGPDALSDQEFKGRVFESVVGADLLKVPGAVVNYWREGGDEVDYVLSLQGAVFGIEVKSARQQTRGLAAFRRRFPQVKTVLLSFDNYPAFAIDPIAFLRSAAT